MFIPLPSFLPSLTSFSPFLSLPSPNRGIARHYFLAHQWVPYSLIGLDNPKTGMRIPKFILFLLPFPLPRCFPCFLPSSFPVAFLLLLEQGNHADYGLSITRITPDSTPHCSAPQCPQETSTPTLLIWKPTAKV
jgi:hypothetical protein